MVFFILCRIYKGNIYIIFIKQIGVFPLIVILHYKPSIGIRKKGSQSPL